MTAWKAHPAAELFPMLAADELQELADDIQVNGLREPVWLYDDPDLGLSVLDGRNRLAACELAGVVPETRTFIGSGEDAITFAVSLNMKRRHLTLGQKEAVAYELLPLYEAAAAKHKAHGETAPGHHKSTLGADLHQASETFRYPDPKPQRAPRATDLAAKAVGASGRGLAQYKRIAENAPDLAEKVKDGSLALDRADRIIRDRDAERRRIEQAKAEAAAEPVPTTVDIRHGDFREVLADLENVDAIITDPPYPQEFIPLLGDLASWADKVLGPDGILAVLIGQTYLPEVYRLLDSGRPYRWTGAYLTPGNGYVSWPRKVQSNWKPLIVYGGGPRFADVIRSEASDADAKNNHKWGQDYGAFHTIIDRLTTRGQTVVDPFMGSGTTLLAAHALGRHSIGCDIEQESVGRARERLS